MTLEERLIKLLADNKGRVVTYKEIESVIPSLSVRQYIMVYVHRLRCKGFLINNIRSTGYEYIGYKKEDGEE